MSNLRSSSWSRVRGPLDLIRLFNSLQIRVPRSFLSDKAGWRVLLVPGRSRVLRFAYTTDEDSNRVLGFSDKEPLTVRLLSLLAAGDVFLDVGASMGIYSIPAADVVGDVGLVVAVEADHTKFIRLEENIRLNGMTQRIRALNFYAGHRSTEPETRALSDYFGPSQLRYPSVIKIDVDGPELQVLQGLEVILRLSRPRLLQVEFDITNDELTSYLADLGFRLIAFETHASRDIDILQRKSIVGNAWFV